MHVTEESSGCIVPAKCPNKGRKLLAEGMEGRRPAKENVRQCPRSGRSARNDGCVRCRVCGRLPAGASSTLLLPGGDRVR